MNRYHWRDENVPDNHHGGRRSLSVYDRRARQEPIAVCADPDVAERIVELLNVAEASPDLMRQVIDSVHLGYRAPRPSPDYDGPFGSFKDNKVVPE